MKIDHICEAFTDKQALSLYNPDSKTYRNTTGGGRIPNSKSISKKDITVKGQRADFPDDSYEPDMLAGVNKEQLEKAVEDSLGTLSKREAMVLRARFGLKPFTQDHTLEQVGNAMGISRDRVRQLEARALRKLKHPKRSRKLRGFVDEQGSTQRLTVQPHMTGLENPYQKQDKRELKVFTQAYKDMYDKARAAQDKADATGGPGASYQTPVMNPKFSPKVLPPRTTPKKPRVAEELYDFDKDEPMKSTVAVPGYGTMSVDSLMKNIIDQTTQMVKQMQSGAQGFRNADYALNSNKVLPAKVAALVQALDDLQAIRKKGGTNSRNIQQEAEEEQQELPVDIDKIMGNIQEFESKQYITPEDADFMRRGVESLGSARQSTGAEQIAVLKLLTMVTR